VCSCSATAGALGSRQRLLCGLTLAGATRGGASTRSQITRTHGLTAPRLLDLQRQWRHQYTPALDQFSCRGAKSHFMTANAAPQPLPEAGLGRDKARYVTARFLIPPV
jgi:hypothetical protein